MSRLRLAAVAALLIVPLAAAAGDRTVYKSPTCGCCEKWIAHMAGHGYRLEPKDLDSGALARLKATFGLKREQSSCHTALVDGYVVEGHVPASDVARLLAEKPDALGLAVPGMPAGSPGMEMEDGTTEPYEVLLVRKDGSSEVFARH